MGPSSMPTAENLVPSSYLQRIPRSVKRMIVSYTGYTPREYILIPLDKDGRTQNEDLRTVINLMKTSKSLYLDLLPLIYSTNFVCRLQGQHDFASFLNQLQPRTIAALRSLTVLFHSTPCTQGVPYTLCKGSSRVEMVHGPDDEPMPLAVNDSEKFAQQSRAVERILHYAGRGKLKLFLTYDGLEFRTATDVLERLLQTGAMLSECSIHLNRSKDPKLINLASQTVSRLTGQDFVSATPFDWMKLPNEIRRHILLYTDLIAPLRRVAWTPTRGFYIEYHLGVACFYGLISKESTEYDHHICLFREYVDDGRYDQIPKNHKKQTSMVKLRCHDLQIGGIGCFCRRYHSAASSRHQCRCWAPPVPLFLAFRALRNEAVPIFFQCNDFDITVGLERFGPARTLNAQRLRLEASIFFERMSEFALKNLRELRINFPPFLEGCCPEGSDIHRDWQQTLLKTKSKLSLQNLKLRVSLHTAIFPEPQDDIRKHMTCEQAQELLDLYRRLIKPLSAFRGLQQFHLLPYWPRCRIGAGPDLSLEDELKEAARYDRRLQTELYEDVMGKPIEHEQRYATKYDLMAYGSFHTSRA